MANPKLATGEIEVRVTGFKLLNKSLTPPVSPNANAQDLPNEELRLEHRYLDLRRPTMQRTLLLRDRIVKGMRDYFAEHGFIDVETPVLGRSTPEGARDYLVPSRISQGSFYALPQSPQLYKQILMMAGYDRYVQVARCFRDEDLRADRQPEFTQLDLEMSFVEANDDAPDLRFGLELVDCTDLAAKSDFRVFSSVAAGGGRVRAINAKKGTEQYSRRGIDALTEYVAGFGAKGLAWFRVEEDGTLNSTIAKNFSPELLKEFAARLKAEPGDLLLFVADQWKVTCKALHALRTKMGAEMKLYDPRAMHFSWVVEFPMFDFDDEEKRWVAMHHPFTSPRDQDFEILESDPGKCRAKAYDLVINGSEAGGGTIRIHDPAIQQTVFSLLGIDEKSAEERFGFLLRALRYGAPPHGGIALGIDRWVMLFGGLDNIRDCIAFPKTQRASDLMTGAPGAVEPKQLRELGIKLNI
jgi:aspartyl-tRNA synthetase